MINTLRNAEIKLGNGEKIDLKDFFNTYYPELSSFASRYIVNSAISEDIVQEVFISFWEKRKTFPNMYAVKAFFYTSTLNSCLDHLKHLKVEEKYRAINKNKEEATESFLDEVIRNEAYSEIYSEINKLPEMGKKVLLLALREHSNDEISKILNIAINTVKTHKARAYKVLRKNLYDIFLFFFLFLFRK
ncbi:MAG: RNA polymerase sigma-70 factor [Bacteroidetes bacterium]|nr:RNA polymerase sigma-70 factor [Bacteroidota bacterium]